MQMRKSITAPTTESQLLAREVRQELFRKIQDCTGRSLLCYVGRHQISEEDVRHLQELLNAAEPAASLDLMLHSPGGDPATAEKLVRMLRNVSSTDTEDPGSGGYRVIVPDQAKSAATLVALGASEIVMSTTSELGPIDPQVSLQDRDGNWIWLSAFDYVEAYEAAEANHRKNPDDPAYRVAFEQLDLVRFRSMQKLIEYTRTCAESVLKRHGGNYTLAPRMLMDRNRFPFHAQVIDCETAKRDIGLRAAYIDDQSSLWRSYWRLYCHLQNAVDGSRKIFESAEVSLLVP